MIRHILFITFKEKTKKTQIDEVRALFMSIPLAVKGVVCVEWGRNDSPEPLSKGFTHCVMMTFKNDAARRYYLDHPAHIRLKSFFLLFLENIIVQDYTIKT